MSKMMDVSTERPSKSSKVTPKKKRTPFKPSKNGAKKFKKGSVKSEGVVKPQKGMKRKHDGKDKVDGDAKKVKIEEMSWKDRKKQRKMSRNNYDLATKLKKQWEEIRRHKMNKEKKEALCKEVFQEISGKAKDLVLAHDTARVVQSLIKYGTVKQRCSLFDELKDSTLDMLKSKYGKFIVMKVLKYGTKLQRDVVFKSFYGNVRKLIRHKHAADVLEYAYNYFANAGQRSAMVEEFYGPSFALFKVDEIRTIEQIMKSHPEKRDSILSNLKEALASLTEKDVMRHSLVHRVYLEFFTYATPKMRSEMIESVRESLIHMLHTREGSRVTMHCLWYGTAKDRKVIVKSMKTYVEKICKEEYGHLVMLALFDVVDDTKLVQKALLEELLKSIKEIAFDQYGKKVLLYMLSPRDKRHFHPDIVHILEQGDNNPTSKKSVAVRRKELLEKMSTPLLQLIVTHTQEFVTNSGTLPLLLDIIAKSSEDPSEAMAAVADVAVESDEEFRLVEDTAGHMTMKRLITNDKERIEQGEAVLFSKILMETVPGGTLKTWATCNRGCFIIVCLLDLGVSEVSTWVKKEMSSVKKSLTKMEFKGAEILLGKLKDE